MKGQDVVISVLGNKIVSALWKPNTIISDGVRNIISGMKKHKVKRLLFVASFGVNEKIFLPEKLFIRIILKNIFTDIPKQEQLIKESALDWSIVHPADSSLSYSNCWYLKLILDKYYTSFNMLSRITDDR